MFSGSWKESSMNVIELEIPDQNIDVEALQVAFGSLYRDDVLINPSRVVALLAAACMLQLDGLIQQCGETMKETITAQTVCGYYNSAGTYGLDSVKKKCLEWLLNNLMTHQSVGLFKELSINLMMQLISSSNLFVLQVEMDVYTALKKWMFLQLVPSWNGSFKQVLTEADAWFAERRREFGGDIAFLESAQGSAFLPVFAHLRLQYIISDLASARIVERDALLPSEWLSSVYKQQWFAMLRAEQDNDIGPQEINKEELEGNSMRCGRKLAKDGDVTPSLVRLQWEDDLQQDNGLSDPDPGEGPGADCDEFGQQTPDVPPVHLLQLPVHITREEGRQRGPAGSFGSLRPPWGLWQLLCRPGCCSKAWTGRPYPVAPPLALALVVSYAALKRSDLRTSYGNVLA
uniref:BACK domain-containing protein n=1 Tax=Ficedula albicollis TaxID=59894 RepID=U3JBK5_FICAL